MLAIKPPLLKNVGFQLSFLATLGIIYLTPFFEKLLEKTKILKTFKLSSLLAMTFAAQIFTLPILIYNFCYFSLVGPITNLLIVPILPYLMGTGFLFLLIGIFWQPLGFIFSLPVWLLLGYLTSVVNFFSQIPWASLTFRISWPWLPAIYFVLGYLTWRLIKTQKLKFLSY
jgi:competence protein ComEC